MFDDPVDDDTVGISSRCFVNEYKNGTDTDSECLLICPAVLTQNTRERDKQT